MASAIAPKEGVEAPGAESVSTSRTGTIHTHVGESHFYAKHGIRSMSESLDRQRSTTEGSDLGTPLKMRNVRKLSEAGIKFPKLEECAHFHYDFVDIKSIQVSLNASDKENTQHYGSQMYQSAGAPAGYLFSIIVVAQSKEPGWMLRRSFENFITFDQQLHRCIYDRKYSLLPEIQPSDFLSHNITTTRETISRYLNRFSSLAGNMINCGPVLSWLEMDNRGNRVLVTDDSSAINTPAVSAAHVIKRYQAQAQDEISLQVGDFLSIIDMPHRDESMWWRGKKGFEVGFFPCECVEVIGDKVPQAIENKVPETPTKPVLRKRGKLITRLFSFFTSRPARTQLKKTGIVKERVFGCDLGEHLLNSKQDVPLILKNCIEMIEEHGIVDGIYRLSGVASNIQKLRNDFDEEKTPNLRDEVYLQDIHSISSLLKAYFRELPNPLLTYQLYEKFAAAVYNEEEKLVKIHDVIQQLPPPHYRTAEILFRHLYKVSKSGSKTGMHCKNLAIVWAPNLMRSKELDRDTEMGCSTAMLQGVGVQAIVTEFLIQYTEVIFSDKLQNFTDDRDINGGRRSRPKSLAISTPTKLLSLEEAREQIMQSQITDSPKQKYIEVGAGPDCLPAEYHTVIELPGKKKSRKSRKSLNASASAAAGGGGSLGASSSWRNIFSRGSKNQNLKKQDSTSHEMLNVAASSEDFQKDKLRAVHSVESLASIGSSTNMSTDAEDSVFRQSVAEEFASVRPKTSTFERPKEKKAKKSSRRSASADLSQSESEFSEHDEGLVISMDTAPHKSSKKSKPSKDAKRAKKKSHARSNSDGPQASEVFKMPPLPPARSRSESKQAVAQETAPAAMTTSLGSSSFYAGSMQDSNTSLNASGLETPTVVVDVSRSPSLKERISHKLTPTSPRKKIKGPAPAPPSVPPAKVESQPTKSKKKAKKSKQKSSGKESLWTTDAPSDPLESQIIPAVAETQQSAPINLSPIEEGQSSDMSMTPDHVVRAAGAPASGATYHYPGSPGGHSLEASMNADMSMSLDSLLKEVVGSEPKSSPSHNPQARFSTFGKSPEGSPVAGANSSPRHAEKDSHIIEPATHEDPPTPRPRYSKRNAQDKKRVRLDSKESVEEIERAASVNSVLETDLDSFDQVADSSSEIVDEEVTEVKIREHPIPHVRFKTTQQEAETEEEHDDERFNYVAPLPGDVRMMSQFSDLSGPNLLSQIDLEDIDVQYVDPWQRDVGEPEAYEQESNNRLESLEENVNPEPAVPAEIRNGAKSSDHSLALDLVVDLPPSTSSQPEAMVVSSSKQSSSETPDVIAESLSVQYCEYEPKAETGRVVVNKPLTDHSEGSIFIPTKTRVVPPPRQFAHVGPPIVKASSDEEKKLETDLDTIEIPNDQKGFRKASAGKKEDDYGQRLVESVVNEHNSLNSVSKPVEIDDNQEIAMAISPLSKTPDSDVAMITSSVESNHMSFEEPVAKPIPLSRNSHYYEPDRKSVEPSETANDHLVFQMEDIKKSSESLHNISMSSDDMLRVEQDLTETVSSNNTEHSGNDFYFDLSLSQGQTDRETDLSQGEEGVNSRNDAVKKPTPVKRKKSVKELLSKFQTADNPPSDIDMKVKAKPAVFQKPKLVRLHSFSKSADDDETSTRSIEQAPVTDSDRNEIKISDKSNDMMNMSFPASGPLLELSPKIMSIDTEKRADVLPQSSDTITDDNDSVSQFIKRPSVRNKIHRFETSTASSLSVSPTEIPTTKTTVSVESHTTRVPPPISPRSNTSPATKEVVIHERQHSKEDKSKSASKTREPANAVFPGAKASDQSPVLRRKSNTEGNDISRTPNSNRASFKMRSAGSGSKPLVLMGDEEPSTPQQSLSERMKLFTSGSSNEKPDSENVISKEKKTTTTHSPPPTVFPKPASRTTSSESSSSHLEKPKPETRLSTKTVAENKEYTRSASVPLSREESPNIFSLPPEDETESSSGSGEVLRPSELFASRRNKRRSEPPPVAPKSNIKKEDQAQDPDIMTTSFSDRRKLFESSMTDSGISGISTASYGSLKRSEVYMKTKAQSLDQPFMTAPSVVHKSIELSHNYKANDSKDNETEQNKEPSLRNQQKVFIVESKSSKPHERKDNLIDDSSNVSVKALMKSRSDQKENVRPSLTVKSSYEKQTVSSPVPDGVERSGSVKDLWRKFEAQNSEAHHTKL